MGMTALEASPFLLPGVFLFFKTLCPLSADPSHLSQCEGYLMVKSIITKVEL
jgi:hypothetical protein